MILEKLNIDHNEPSTSANDVAIIQPPINIEGFKMTSKNDEFVRILEEKLKQIRLNVISQDNDSSNSNISDTEDIDELAKIFANTNVNNTEVMINPVYASKPVEKYYYKRPSPQDLLCEEKEPYQNSYSGKTIYEWNIDGLNDKQIIDLVHRMLMYSTVCKQQGNTDSGIASFIVTGFIGQLRGWWDYYLNEAQRNEILTHKKLVQPTCTSTPPVAIEQEDAVYTMCLCILQHFVGANVPIAEKLQTLLQNLRWFTPPFCRKGKAIP
ncbi:hypothetical protein A2U01_0012803 [Trifolium medium]|uniref:DUF7746 domain-containing protein n=1 Tax=Trifolium medium TaxID=97028 RepID=A0A392MX43_9FABA|nr:hypothetical protein [Trifolium medium]